VGLVALWAIVACWFRVCEASCPSNCSSRGVCRDGSCVCASGWAGADCSFYLAGGDEDEDEALAEESDERTDQSSLLTVSDAPMAVAAAASQPAEGIAALAASTVNRVSPSITPQPSPDLAKKPQMPPTLSPALRGVMPYPQPQAMSADVAAQTELDAMETQVAAMEAQLAALGGAVAAPGLPPVLPAEPSPHGAVDAPGSTTLVAPVFGFPAAAGSGGFSGGSTSGGSIDQGIISASKGIATASIASGVAARLRSMFSALWPGTHSTPSPPTKAEGIAKVRQAVSDAGDAASRLHTHAMAKPASVQALSAPQPDDLDDEDSGSWKAPVRQAKEVPQTLGAPQETTVAAAAAARRRWRTDSSASASIHTAEVPGAPGPGACWEDCNGHGSCESSSGKPVCQCHQGWVGLACDMPTCPEDCNGNGVCMMGKCVCDKAWHGPSCALRRCPDDCSGVGYCFEGVCQCSAGFGGPNCAKVMPVGQRLAVKLHRAQPLNAPVKVDTFVETASLRGMQPPLCPGNCSNRGVCNDRGNCECLAGYSGQACQSYCPNECSHQGDCIEGACLCFAGFVGEDCSVSACCSGHGSCDEPDVCECEEGWGGQDCSLKMLCDDPSCSGHGSCDMGRCVCEVGYSGATCSLMAGGCNPPCTSHGMCNPDTKRCDCEQGFTGETCSAEVMTCPNHCSNKGLCFNGECMCGAGWGGADCSQRHFTPGEAVGELLPPRNNIGVGAGGELSGSENDGLPPEASPGAGSFLAVSANGRVRESAAAASGHSGHPALGSSDAFPAATAEPLRSPKRSEGAGLVQQGAGLANPMEEATNAVAVLVGYPSAEEAAAAKLTGNTGGEICGTDGLCSGHGTCNESFGKCECFDLWRGAVCDVEGCPGFLETGKDCSGHGVCQAGACICAAGWGIEPEKVAAANATNPAPPNACADAVCPVPCSEHGVCRNGQCVCDQGWQGPNCRDPQCPGACSGHGVCTQPSPNSPGECTCDYGWGGSACSRLALYQELKVCPLDCSGNGLCMNGICACNVGFSGPACSDVTCPPGYMGPKCDVEACPNDCSGHGLCFAGKCSCLDEYTGDDCFLPARCYEPCRDVCAPPAVGFSAPLGLPTGVLPPAPGMEHSQTCNYCIGACLTAANNFPLGRHDPFEDLQATFLQGAHPWPNSPAAANASSIATSGRAGAGAAKSPGGGKRVVRHRHHREISAVPVVPARAAPEHPAAPPTSARSPVSTHRKSPRSFLSKHRRHRRLPHPQPAAHAKRVAETVAPPPTGHRQHREVRTWPIRPAAPPPSPPRT